MATIPLHKIFLLLVFTGLCSTESSLRFLLIGDMGGLPTWPYKTLVEVGTSDEMAKVAKQYSPHFIMQLGDNFYFDGVKDVDDKRFEVTFEKVYKHDSLQIPWYLIAGNHDHNGNVTAQIAYSQRSKRWNFPSPYYPLSAKVPNSDISVDFVMMDTILLCGNSGNDELHAQPTGPEDTDVAETQWDFIQNSLSKSRASYLFTAGHFPVLSIAEHGPTKCLVDRLMPMLHKYGASGHFSGHDHNLQHLRSLQNNSTVDYILSGCANFIDTSEAHRDAVPSGASLFHWADPFKLGGFVFAEATAVNMTFTYIEASGKILYQTTVFPRKV